MSVTRTLAGGKIQTSSVCGVGPFGPDTSANIGAQIVQGTYIGYQNKTLPNYSFSSPHLVETFILYDGVTIQPNRDVWHLYLLGANYVEINGVIRCDGNPCADVFPLKGGGSDGGAGSGGGGGGGGRFSSRGGSSDGGDGGVGADGQNGQAIDGGTGGDGTQPSWTDNNAFTNAIFGTAGSGGNGSDDATNSDPDEGIGASGSSFAAGGGGGGAGIQEGSLNGNSFGGGGGGGVIGIVCNEFTMGTNGRLYARGGWGNGVDWPGASEPVFGNAGGGGGGGCVSIWTKKYDGSANGKISVAGGGTSTSFTNATAGTAGTIQIFELTNKCAVAGARTLTDTWDNT